MKSPTRQDLDKLSHNKQVMFACFCAEQVMRLVKEEHRSVCLRAVQTAYLFLEGKVTKEDCRSAADAAADAAAAAANAAAAYAAAAYAAAANAAAADAAADAAAADAAAAANAADAAANAADKLLIVKAQWDFYDQLLNGDTYFEQIVLNSYREEG